MVYQMNVQTFLCLFVVLFGGCLCSSQAYKFYVGGGDGWVVNPKESFNQWAERNRFLINDTLYFKYKKGSDSVLLVNKEDYYNCNTEHPLKKMDGGDSELNLDRSGPFFFISGNQDHCKKGQKLIVAVLHERTPPATPKTPPPSTTTPPPHHAPSPVIPPKPVTPPSQSPTTNPPKVSPGPATPPAHQTPTPSQYPPSPAPVMPPKPITPSQSPNYSPKVSPAPATSPKSSAPVPATSPTATPPSGGSPPVFSPSPLANTPTQSPSGTPADVTSPPAPSPSKSAAALATPSFIVVAVCVVLGNFFSAI
ncbi:hypothetical protein Dsin_021959 [Dipteronia sinensis]|uniref:Phytocyanin domain-containing protein n=1 Tax=Dipteronia sinensis TaxID=43782 RepID=A0AAE0A0P7_9ROSI|nr:hypothetical protein Dsin_021959 [Dipteronia sinensis]